MVALLVGVGVGVGTLRLERDAGVGWGEKLKGGCQQSKRHVQLLL